MPATGLNHFNIVAPADQMEEVKAFYMDVLGMTEGYRPEQFSFDGYWLYAGDRPVLHLAAGDGPDATSTGHLNHIALDCEDLDGMKTLLSEKGIPYKSFHLSDVNQMQLFIHDPAGVRLELNFKL
jgi:catechol 2,3-dioxygenase-like lactoylglutathione lyase family enzyme